eukprot:5081958-Alexandrium_andersonii.AAC.1
MSASLVGSEMCIRDSYTLSNLASGVICTQVSPKLVLTAGVILWSAFTVPVSYTHLTLPTICSV